ncbi:MAG: hypothetical protein GC168_16420 [Candidatus Hydrogenedens sp.]|nr:hypothetical protein [Candidatus Hydrogenedens sp.]
MSARSSILNAALAAGSVAVLLALTMAADRMLGPALFPRPALPGTMELIFPPNATQSYATDEFAYTAHINRLGLRERDIPAAPDGKYRICAIGDSYTYGWGVEAEDTWLRHAEQALIASGHDVQTINMGKPGSGPDWYAELAEKSLPLLQPDLVVVAILLGNDVAASGPSEQTNVERAVANRLGWFYPNLTRWMRTPKVADDQRTQEMPPQVTRAEDNRKYQANTAHQFLEQQWNDEERAKFEQLEPKVKESFLSGGLNPYLIDLALKNNRFYNITMNLDDSWLQTCIDRLSDHLGRIKRVAESYGAQVLVVAVPDGPYVNQPAWEDIQRVGYEVDPGMIDSNAPDEAVRIAANKAGLPFATVSQVFKERRDEDGLYFELDGHLTAKGHALYGEAIAPVIAKQIDGGAQ